MELLVGIDDTDSIDSDHGTGRVSRDLAAQLAADHDLDCCGSVRQQFLVDPRVPYTTHNSAACLIFETESSAVEGVIDDAGSFLAEIMADVADPGLCVAATEAVPEAVTAFGRRAQEDVLEKANAYDVAATVDELFLDEYGGTGDGVIGALGAVGITASGTGGRYIAYGRIREYGDTVSASTLRADGIAVEPSDGAEVSEVSDEDLIYTHDWVRPERRNGGPLLPVERGEQGWRPANLSKAGRWQ